MSAASNRYRPPGVFVAGTEPESAQRRTVEGSTRNLLATSLVVRCDTSDVMRLSVAYPRIRCNTHLLRRVAHPFLGNTRARIARYARLMPLSVA